ncbi:alpha-keto acid decarboxylase family protein [Microbacterium sp. 179-I 3D3 NHS]|uniref:alpha-keto acid decarboxylase family protein n=1 Tax=Microbacterium sp. 179-I 3D3 NHS TaxID=3142382 RepID=UPI00399FBFCC
MQRTAETDEGTAPVAYTVTDRLLDRIAEAGVDRVFGVPGDFTLGLLDHVEVHERVTWVGTANELGAGYAADGYARIRGLGVLCTTFGVGELSAINAVAGSYAEHVPVLHLVGAPTTATQRAARPTHHTLGDGDFRHFARMSDEITCVQGFLTADNAAEEIDRVLTEVMRRRVPGYLLLPADVAQAESAPPTSPFVVPAPLTEATALAEFRSAAAELLSGAPSVAVLADILVQRMGAQDALDALLACGLPHATLLWGRRVVDERRPGYLGSYIGEISAPEVRAGIEGADVLIQVGVQFTDLTSGFYSQHLPASTIEIRPNSARVGSRSFSPVAMHDALEAVTEVVSERPRPTTVETDDPAHPVTADPRIDDGALTQISLWQTVSAALRPGDLVLADQGTAFYGMATHRLPHDALFIGQPLWASIGYTLPALLGAATAAPERRPIVLIGDGAAQLTIAELGTLARAGVPATVLIVDNDGYTIERAIHGAQAQYNDIARWDWTALAAALAPSADVTAVRVETAAELATALDEIGSGLTVIQAVVPRLDIPPFLAALAALAARANADPQREVSDPRP